jgi:hypothetical protein
MGALEQGAMPDSERTVYRRVPQDLLQRAKKTAVSEAPPPAPRAAFYDDGDDRTAVFVPPRELLLSGRSEPAPPLPPASEDAGDSAPGRVTPVIAEQVSLSLAQTRSKPAPAPEPEPELATQRAAPADELVAANGSELVAPSATRRRRTIALVAFFVFLFLAAGLAYIQYSGRPFFIPS